MATDILLSYPEAGSVCGPNVNREFRADGELVLPDGREFFLELDTGETSYRQHRRRQAVYKNLNSTQGVLFVTLGERRLKGIIEHIGPLADVALFALYRDVLANPFGEIWRDAAGARGVLMRATAAGGARKNPVEKP